MAGGIEATTNKNNTKMKKVTGPNGKHIIN